MADSGDVVGTAVVNLQAETSSFLSSITSAASQATSKFEGMGKSMGSAANIGAAGLGAAAVGLGAFALESASKIDGAFSQMAKSTGAQGAQLAMLETSWKSVYSSVPTDAATVTSVIDKVSNSLHLQGQALTDATTDIINYGRATGTDAVADTDSFTQGLTAANNGLGAMNQPLITVSQLSDMSTVAFQRTGKGIQDWGPAFDKATASMTAMGMSIPQQVAALSSFSQAGIPARQLTSLLQGIAPAAQKAGESQTQFWNQLLEAGKTGNYTQDQLKLLGKNVDNFTAACKSGTMTNTDFINSLKNSAGATDKAAEANETFSEKLQLFKQRLEVAFEPLGKALIGILSSVLTAVQPIIPVITTLANAFAAIPGPIQLVVIAGVALVGGIGALNLVLGKFGMSLKSLPMDIGKVTSSLKDMFTSVASGKMPSLSALTGGGGAASTKKECPFPEECFSKAQSGAKGVTDEIGNAGKEGEGLAGELGGASGEAEGLAGGLGEAAEGGGLLSGVIGGLPGPLAGILGSVGGLGGGMGAAVAASGPLIPITATVGAGLGVMALTSGTFKGMLGGAATTAGNVLTQVKGIAGALMSGDFSKAGDMLKQSFQGAVDTLTHFDFKNWGVQMITSIKESVGNIGGIILNGLSSLGDIASKVGDYLANINWDQVINGLIKSITDMFGGGGGGGTAGTKVSTGMNQSLVDGATKAAPNVFAKLLPAFANLAVQLILLMPKIAAALIMALAKVDWGTVAHTLLTALQGALVGIVNWLASLDWGSYAHTVLTALEGALIGIVNWLKSLDWGGFAALIWNDLIGAIGQIIGWIEGLDWGGFATTVYNDLIGAIGQIVGWFEGLDWGSVGRSLLSGIETIGGDIINWFTTLNWGAIGDALKNAILGALGQISFDTHIPGVGVVTLAEGGVVSGGHLAVIGEAGPEMVVPQKYWNMVDPALVSMLPHYAGGGVVGGGGVAAPMFGGAYGSSSDPGVNAMANKIGQQFEAKWHPTQSTLAGVWQTLMMGLTNWQDALKVGDYKTATDAQQQMMSDVRGFVQQQYGNGTTANTILTQISNSLAAQEAAAKAALAAPSSGGGSSGSSGGGSSGGGFTLDASGTVVSSGGIELDDPNINPGPGYWWSDATGTWMSTDINQELAASQQYAGGSSPQMDASLRQVYAAAGHAKGGIAVNPTFGVFGEAGPEALIPLTSATGKKALGTDDKQATPMNFNIHIDNATLTSTKEAQKLGLQIAYSAKRELSRSGYSRGS